MPVVEERPLKDASVVALTEATLPTTVAVLSAPVPHAPPAPPKLAGVIGNVRRSSKSAALLLGVIETVPQTKTKLPTLEY